MSSEERGATTAQLKADINSGLTGDKNADDILAAAPLGTDDEAAGSTVSPAAVQAVRRQQFSPEAQRVHSPRQGRSIFAVVLPIAAVAVITAAGAALMLLR